MTLTPVEMHDANFIHHLRSDPELSGYLSPPAPSLEAQVRWLEGYRKRAKQGQERYYVIRDLVGRPLGTVRLYEIKPNEFTWGSWILHRDRPKGAALESYFLSMAVGFDEFGCERALIDVRTANTRARRFYDRMGFQELRREAEDIYYEYTASAFAADRQNYFHASLAAVQTRGNP